MTRILDLFAGCGGFSLGFHQAGLPTTRAVENFKPVAASYAENLPDVELFVEDIQRLGFQDPFDLVIGGPPCEPYTSGSAVREENPLDRMYKNKIGGLVLHYIRLVGLVKPRFFVMENVLQVAEGPLRGALESEFKKVGFPKIHFNELFAENYGTPSHRRRLFISNIKIDPPRVTGKSLLVKDTIGDLPKPGTNKDINHLPHPLSADKRARIERSNAGEALYSYKSGTGRTHGNWRRLNGDEIAPTVTGNARFIHPTQDRLLTVREHARLMGYPDTYIFRGGRDIQYDVIGESVPPPLAKAIALTMRSALGLPPPPSPPPPHAPPTG